MKESEESGVSEKQFTVRIYMSWIVVVIWSLAAIVAFFTQNFEELGIVTPVMMIVMGFLFSIRSNGKQNGR